MTSLTRCGDPEPLHDFIVTGMSDDAGELANLNYWAYWVGEWEGIERDDTFMTSTQQTWPGSRLLGHLASRLTPDYGYLPLYVHTAWALLTYRPGLLRADLAVPELAQQARSLLDTAEITGATRRELEAILYAVRLSDR